MNEVGLFLLLMFSMTEKIMRSTLLLAVAFCGHAKPCNLGVFLTAFSQNAKARSMKFF